MKREYYVVKDDLGMVVLLKETLKEYREVKNKRERLQYLKYIQAIYYTQD